MSRPPPLKVGLTGGVASGKSEVARRFAALGAPVADADAIARALVAPGQAALAAIVEHFGDGVLDPSGALDRRALRERVFADPGQRRALEDILHPRIRAGLQAAAQAATHPYVVIDIPLLAEGGGRAAYPWLDRILVVDVPREVQLARLQARDGIDAALAARMLDAQSSREQRLAIADDRIDNTGTLDALDAAVARLHRDYLAAATRRR